jgi:hypothetical protein
MEKIIIIAADLGHFKAYRITRDPLEMSPRVMLIESYDSIEGHGRLSEKLSNSAGQFGRGGGKDDESKGAGERHNIKLETEKRLAKMIARDIDALIVSEGCETWYLAAGEKINSKIIENLSADVRAQLAKNISADLTKTDKSEILDHFS